MTAFLALVAVVAFMATAGLPWWVVVAVALLMAGFAAGRSWSPGKGSKASAASGQGGQPIWSSADRCSTVRPVSVNVPGAGPEEEYAHSVSGGGSPTVPSGSGHQALGRISAP